MSDKLLDNLFSRAFLKETTRIVFELYVQRCFYKYPGAYKFNDYESFCTAMDGYATIAKQTRNLLLMRKFVINVLQLSVKDFDHALKPEVKRNRRGKHYSYDHCVRVGNQVRHFLETRH